MRWTVLGWLCLAAAALRHQFVYGADLFGRDLSFELGIFEGACLLGFALFAGRGWIEALREAPTRPGGERWIWHIGFGLTAFAVLLPPFLSTDVFDYVARGQVEAGHGANPYTVPPGHFPGDPIAAQAGWPEYVMPYGPITAVLQWLMAAVVDWVPGTPAGSHVWVGVYGFKAVFAAAHLGTAWCIARALQSRGDAAVRKGLVAWLWNPFLLLESATNAHNEALMALALAGTVVGVARDRWVLGITAFGMAVLVKHGCAPLGPLLLVLAWRLGRLRQFFVGVGISAAITGAFALHYFLEPGALEWISNQVGVRQTSLQAFADLAFGHDSHQLVQTIGFGAVLGALAWAAIGVRRPESFGNRGARVMLAFLLLPMAQFSPWYHLWWLPLLGLWDARGLDRFFVALTITGPASYVVFATTRSFSLDHQITQWSLGLAIPLIAATWPSRRR